MTEKEHGSVAMGDNREKARRSALSDHEAMLDAQGLCVPCKLCGGSAEISDAGTGAGYYIRCENAQFSRPSKGCLITDQRLGGWAYNVMEWWNRLHAAPQPAHGTSATDPTDAMIAAALNVDWGVDIPDADVVREIWKAMRAAAPNGASATDPAPAAAQKKAVLPEDIHTLLWRLSEFEDRIDDVDDEARYRETVKPAIDELCAALKSEGSADANS